MGISPALVQQPYPFDWKMLMPLLSLTIGVSFITVYISNYANSFVEYTRAFFLWVVGSGVNFGMSIMIFKGEQLFELISRCDTIVNASEWTSEALKNLN